MYIPPKRNLIPSHANCMQLQHVLRCWERQSDCSEVRIQENPSSRPGLRPDPAEGTYSAPAIALVGWEGLAVPSPRTHPHSRPFGPRLFYPHSKISSDAHAQEEIR